MTRARWFLPLLVLGACHHGGTTTAPPDLAEPAAPEDMAEPQDLGFVEASHAPSPQVPSQGGPVMSAPHVVTITFPEFPYEAEIVAYTDWLMTSSYFTTVGAEYGIGAGTHTHVLLTQAAPTSISQDGLAQLLAQLQAAGTVEGPSAETQFMFVLPPSTTLSDAPGPCADNYSPAYHTEAQSGRIFGVVATCKVSPVDQVELSLSHEIVEAASDPYPGSAPAYFFQYSDPWILAGGEIADMCDMPLPYVVGASTYVVPRIWSNAQAALGLDPCLPKVDAPFYTTSGKSDTGVIPLGGDVTVQLVGWSTGPTADWNVQAVGEDFGSGVVPIAAIDTDIANNGTVINLTVTAPASAKVGDQLGVLVYSLRNDVTSYTTWPLVLTVQ